MNDYWIHTRNACIHFLYRNFVKKIFFYCDPENVHDHIIRFGQFLGRNQFLSAATSFFFDYSHPKLPQTLCGIEFKNPVGLSAGFDKNAVLTRLLPSIGFGFAEVGSITGEWCVGNPGRHLWRLPRSKGLVVYYGLKNDGCERIAARLKKESFRIPIGISVAKTNSSHTVDVQSGIDDYAKAFEAFRTIGAYTTVNISCPNAYGGQPFSDDPKMLDRLLSRIDAIETQKPTFLKLSPDLSYKEVDTIIDIAKNHRIHGFVCTNLVKDRNKLTMVKEALPHCGGISGKPLESYANMMIKYVYQRSKGSMIIMGSGGVFSSDDAYTKIRLGASLIQIITGMIFEGPQLVSEINRGLVALLNKDGFQSISDAVGVDAV